MSADMNGFSVLQIATFIDQAKKIVVATQSKEELVTEIAKALAHSWSSGYSDCLAEIIAENGGMQ